MKIPQMIAKWQWAARNESLKPHTFHGHWFVFTNLENYFNFS